MAFGPHALTLSPAVSLQHSMVSNVRYALLGFKEGLVVQVHKPSQEGAWHLEHTPCIEVLVKNKAAIVKALTDAKYDKITHVRQAVGKALVEMDCIPSPKAKPTIASMLSGEDSDLESMLAHKRAKPNSRPWSGASSDLPRAGSGGDALKATGDQDFDAPSPR